jgi:hypothetical protein
MPWTDAALDQLAAMPACSYTHDGPVSTEPTAFAAMALLQHGRPTAARRHLAWLARHQNSDGSLGVTATEIEPCWPTSLAILAWQQASELGNPKRKRGELPTDPASPTPASPSAATGSASAGVLSNSPPASSGLDYTTHCNAAVDWLLTLRGETMPRNEQFGHDVTLTGWPWVAGTHSWIEPTSFAVLALRATGRVDDPRYDEALRLLVDRQLPTGGCNYGNTIVLGNTLFPHTQPTGIALLALAETRFAGDPRIARSLAWLHEAVSSEQGASSLAFGLWALAVHQQPHAKSAALLAASYARAARRPLSAYHLSLLLLARAATQATRSVSENNPKQPEA